jgi:hypothetical protein
MRPHCDGMLLNLSANIRLEWMLMAVANTLAYYVMATNMFVKKVF